MAKDEQNGGLKWTRHPVVDGWLPPLAETEIRQWLKRPDGETQVLQYWTEHERLVRESVEDPLNHGFELPFWREVRALLERKRQVFMLGGNGTGKTEIGGKITVEQLCAGKNMKVLCVATNDGASKQIQQPAVFKYLPAALKNLNDSTGPRKRSTKMNVTYSQKGGFTEGTFVLPNGSQCWFKTVEQYIRDATSFEGPEYNFIWLDEPVVLALLEALEFRAGKVGGKLLHTFTAVFGYDATCAKVLTGARLVKSLPMNWAWDMSPAAAGAAEAGGAPDAALTIPELDPKQEQVKGCPPGHMPFIMQPLNPAQGVIFCWTHWNVFLTRSKERPKWPAIFEECVRKSPMTVRMRLFGWAEKLAGCQFPAFDPNVHVVSAARIEKLLKDGELTIYQAGDPATARSYFMLWLGVDRMGRKFIIDESPRIDEGEWVNSAGQRGDGTKIYGGKGTDWYKAYIRLREKELGAPALRRFGDPRAFATEAAAEGGSRSLFELFAATGRGDNELAGPMFWEPAKVKRSLVAEAATGSLDKINDAFAWDDEKERTVENEPRLYVSDRCENLIRAITSWDPIQGESSPWKDPIDVLRYLFGEELYWVDPEVPEIVAGRGF